MGIAITTIAMKINKGNNNDNDDKTNNRGAGAPPGSANVPEHLTRTLQYDRSISP